MIKRDCKNDSMFRPKGWWKRLRFTLSMPEGGRWEERRKERDQVLHKTCLCILTNLFRDFMDSFPCGQNWWGEFRSPVTIKYCSHDRGSA